MNADKRTECEHVILAGAEDFCVVEKARELADKARCALTATQVERVVIDASKATHMNIGAIDAFWIRLFKDGALWTESKGFTIDNVRTPEQREILKAQSQVAQMIAQTKQVDRDQRDAA